MDDRSSVESERLRSEMLQRVNDQLRQTVVELQNQLNEALAFNAQQTDPNQELQQRIAELELQLSTKKEPAVDDKEVEDLRERLKNAENSTKTLLQELDRRDKETQELLKTTRQLKQKCKHCQEQKRALVQNLEDARSSNEELKATLDASMQRNEVLEREIVALKNIQLPVAEEQQEVDMSSVYNIFTEQFEAQASEICILNEEKQKLCNVLALSHSAGVATEKELEKANAEITRLKALRIQNPPQQEFSLEFPFDDPLKSECESLSKLTQYKLPQRIQLVLNATARYITDLKAEYEELQKSYDSISETQDQEFQEPIAQQTNTAFKTFLRDLRSYVFHKDWTDDEFRTFIISKSLEAPENDEELPQGFFTEASIESRITALKKLFDIDGPLTDIFVAQFVMNAILAQNQAPPDKMSVQSESSDKIKALKKVIQKQMKENEDLKRALDETREEVLKGQVELENKENEILLAKIQEQLNQNRLALERQQLRDKTPSQTIIDELRQQIIAQKRLILEQETIATSAKEEANRYKVALGEQEKLFQKEVVALENQMNALQDSLKQQKKSIKRDEARLKDNLERKLAQEKDASERLRQRQASTIEELTDKLELSTSTITELTDRLHRSEDKNGDLQKRITQLTQSNRVLEVGISQLKAKSAVDHQALEGRLSAMVIANEENLRTNAQSIAKRCDDRIARILSAFESALGGLYTGGEIIEEDTLLPVLERVAEDLRRLQKFDSDLLPVRAVVV